MDAVRAPDALVEKTLQLMLEEHKKEEHKKRTVKTEADAGPRQIKASPQKTRWITHVALPAAACLFLCLTVIVPRLLNRGVEDIRTASVSPSLQTPAPGVSATDGPTGSITKNIVQALAADSLATRSGPATQYRETGTYQVKGEYVRLVSLAYDGGGLCWVQCEVLYGNTLRRVYTGLQRFDAATFDLDGVPEEAPLGYQAKVTATSKAMYGPGDGYGAYAQLTVDKGQTVTVIAVESDYAQVEWTTSTQSYRAWVPAHTLEQVPGN